MDYTQSDAYVTHVGTGHRMHQDTAPITTEVAAADMNMLVWSLMEILNNAGVAGAAFDPATPATYQKLVNALAATYGGFENLDKYENLVVGADWSAALAAAVATGKSVYVPGRAAVRNVSVGVTLADRQVIYGDGAASRIKLTTTLAVLFNANGRTGAGLRALSLEGPGITANIAASYTQSAFTGLSSPVDCFVDHCTLTGWAGGPIFFQDATGCSVTHNRFHNAMCMPLASDNFGTSDCSFWGSTVDCRFESNYSNSGASYGCNLSTISGAAQTSWRFKCRGNQIHGAKVYAILVYNQSSGVPPVTNNIYDTEIVGNTIKDVYGAYNNPASGLKDFGAGIYVLSAERTIIGYNIVENVCINTAGSTLTPAAISYNAASTVSIVGNKIKTSAWYGIFVTDGLQLGEGANAGSVNFAPSGYTVIEGNTIEDTVKHGIYIKDKHKVRCQGNTVNNVTGVSQSSIVTEVAVANYPTMKWISIVNNSAYGWQTAAILSGLTQGADISGNQLDGTGGGTRGIFAESTDATINGNNIRSVAGIGIELRTTGANSMMAANKVTLCTTGIQASHRVCWGENDVRANTTNWSGSYAYMQNVAPTAGTWLVDDRVRKLTAAVGSPKAWVCTVAGTPGTWVSEGNL